MNRTRVTNIYNINYCTFCKAPATEVSGIWGSYYLCNCIDAREFSVLCDKSKEIHLSINDIELKCNLEHSYRKMIQMELFNEQN